VPLDQLATAAENIARRLARQPLGAVLATKRLMRDAAEIVQHMNEEGAVFARQLTSPEAKEAFTAFVERRAPDFAKFN
jgi:enoyl-CoA hydratase/carnithine racemase